MVSTTTASKWPLPLTTSPTNGPFRRALYEAMVACRPSCPLCHDSCLLHDDQLGRRCGFPNSREQQEAAGGADHPLLTAQRATYTYEFTQHLLEEHGYSIELLEGLYFAMWVLYKVKQPQLDFPLAPHLTLPAVYTQHPSLSANPKALNELLQQMQAVVGLTESLHWASCKQRCCSVCGATEDTPSGNTLADQGRATLGAVGQYGQPVHWRRHLQAHHLHQLLQAARLALDMAMAAAPVTPGACSSEGHGRAGAQAGSPRGSRDSPQQLTESVLTRSNSMRAARLKRVASTRELQYVTPPCCQGGASAYSGTGDVNWFARPPSALGAPSKQRNAVGHRCWQHIKGRVDCCWQWGGVLSLRAAPIPRGAAVGEHVDYRCVLSHSKPDYAVTGQVRPSSFERALASTVPLDECQRVKMATAAVLRQQHQGPDGRQQVAAGGCRSSRVPRAESKSTTMCPAMFKDRPCLLAHLVKYHAISLLHSVTVELGSASAQGPACQARSHDRYQHSDGANTRTATAYT